MSTPELPIPQSVRDAERAMELARIWIADGNQVVVLSGHLWDDPAAWGLMLVDLAKHVANAYNARGANREEVLQRIRDAFDTEWQSPTDEPRGGAAT